MSGQIRLSPEQMQQRATAFRTEGSNVNDVIRKMDGLIDNLQSEWEGAASTEFAAQYRTLKPSFQKMENLIQDIAKQLDGTANAMRDLDGEIAKKFKI